MLPGTRTRVIIAILVWSATSLLATGAATAQLTDEVVLQGSRSSSRITMKCRVLDFTGRILRARVAGATREQTFAADEIVSVRTPQTTAHDQGIEQLQAGDAVEAEVLLEKALDEEPRQWVRREILALLVRCALRRNDFARAGSRFRLLFASDEDTRHINLIPLKWGRDTVGGVSRSTAAAWLRDTDSVSQLLGSSLLLFDPQHGQVARDTLKQLSRKPPERIRQLAFWQQWRLRIAAGQVSDLDIEHRESALMKLEPILRAGPYFLLAEAFLVRQDFDIASATFLQIPLVYDSDHPISADALFEAGNAIRKNGLRVEAAQLYQEVMSRYAWSQAAKSARTSLDELIAEAAQK